MFMRFLGSAIGHKMKTTVDPNVDIVPDEIVDKGEGDVELPRPDILITNDLNPESDNEEPGGEDGERHGYEGEDDYGYLNMEGEDPDAEDEHEEDNNEDEDDLGPEDGENDYIEDFYNAEGYAPL
jgi:hypothetical protein